MGLLALFLSVTLDAVSAAPPLAVRDAAELPGLSYALPAESATTTPAAAAPAVEPNVSGKYFGARYYGSKIGRFTTVDPSTPGQTRTSSTRSGGTGMPTPGTTRCGTWTRQALSWSWVVRTRRRLSLGFRGWRGLRPASCSTPRRARGAHLLGTAVALRIPGGCWRDRLVSSDSYRQQGRDDSVRDSGLFRDKERAVYNRGVWWCGDRRFGRESERAHADLHQE